MKLITVSGINPIREILKKRPSDVKEILVARKGRQIDQIINLANNEGIEIRRVDKDYLHKIASHKNHQGIVAKVKGFSYWDIDSFLRDIKDTEAILLLLDSIEDPQNFGSIARSASFFGVNGILIPEYRSVSVTDVVCKVSAGGIFYVPIIRVKNLIKAIELLKSEGFLIIGLDVHARDSIYDMKVNSPRLGLVIGNEHRGIKKRVKERCDVLVNIPRFGEMESLNAAVSAAVALSEVKRRQYGEFS